MRSELLPSLGNYQRSLMHRSLLEAYDFARANNIPRKAYQAYRNQFDSAKRRAIEWLFTFDEWLQWWQEFDPRHGCVRWERRGCKGTNILMMTRFNDVGPYSPENVYCGTSQDNMRDRCVRRHPRDWNREWHATHDSWLKGNRGDGHPRAKPVMTEMGRFGSIALAAEAAGITRAGGLNRVRIGRWTLC